MALVADACVSPTTFGTATGVGAGAPLETTRLTAEPFATLVPAAGLWLITLPEATVVLDCCVTAPTVRPALVMALVAAACVWPTTFGTGTCAGGGAPVETMRLAADALVTPVPPAVLTLIQLPEASVPLASCEPVP